MKKKRPRRGIRVSRPEKCEALVWCESPGGEDLTGLHTSVVDEAAVRSQRDRTVAGHCVGYPRVKPVRDGVDTGDPKVQIRGERLVERVMAVHDWFLPGRVVVGTVSTELHTPQSRRNTIGRGIQRVTAGRLRWSVTDNATAHCVGVKQFCRPLTALLIAALALIALAAPAGASGASGPITNPSANIPARPGFNNVPGPCASYQFRSNPTWRDPACTFSLLRAINRARGILHQRAMVLPSNWYQLSIAEQLFVVVDLERTAIGLPAYIGLNTTLNREAQTAAAQGHDPWLAPGFPVVYANGSPAAGGVWAASPNPLAADYWWMYFDGWSGATTNNGTCRSAGSPGCWGHRDELLGYDARLGMGPGVYCTTCEVGAGYGIAYNMGSMVVLVERPTVPPAVVFSWRGELPYFRHPLTPPTSPTTTTTTTTPTATTSTSTLTPGASVS